MIPPGIRVKDFESLLDYFYGSTIGESTDADDKADEVGLFVLSKVLDIKSLTKECVECFKDMDSDDAIVYMMRIQQPPTPDSIAAPFTPELQQDLQPLFDFSINYLATHLSSIDESLLNLHLLPQQIASIFQTAATLQTFTPLEISQNICRVCREATNGNDQNDTFHALSQFIQEVDPCDALFVNFQLDTPPSFEQLNLFNLCKSSLTEDSLTGTFYSWYLDSYCCSFELLLAVLDRSDLMANNEDQVFDCVCSYVTEKKCTQDEQIQLWSTVRYTHLSQPSVISSLDIDLIPKKWLSLAFAGVTILQNEGVEGFDHFLDEKIRIAKFKRKRQEMTDENDNDNDNEGNQEEEEKERKEENCRIAEATLEVQRLSLRDFYYTLKPLGHIFHDGDDPE